MIVFSSTIKKTFHISDSDFTFETHVWSRILKVVLGEHFRGGLISQKAGSTKHCSFQNKSS